MASAADPQARFWQWFQANGNRLQALMYGEDAEAREEASEELRRAVHAVEPGLVLEIATPPTAEVGELVVSADSHRELVDAVKDFVAAAPALNGWQVMAFRPRMNIAGSVVIRLEDEEVSPDDVWFRIEEGDDGLELTLHVRGLTQENEKLRGLGAMLLAEHSVGEQDAMTMLASLDVEPLSDDPVGEGLEAFEELVGVFDRVMAEKYPPPGLLLLDEGGEYGMRGTINDAPFLGMLNTALRPVVGHPDYDWRLVVTIPYQADPEGLPLNQEEYDAVEEVGEHLGEQLQQEQESLLALSLMTQGRRDLILYTYDPQSALQRLEELRAEAPRDFEANVERDTFWGMYRAFLQGAQQEQDEDEE